MSSFRIGIIGYGYIGQSLYELFRDSPIEVASIHDHLATNISSLPKTIATADAGVFLERLEGLDLVVEVAHPDVSRNIGAQVLDRTNYMPCSVVALADEEIRSRLLSSATRAGTNLYVPHGAVVGMDNLIEARANWKSATITFRKPPASIDTADETGEEEELLFEGSARDIAERFPRSVNAMVACALATVGLDATITRIIADRRLRGILRGEFEFTGIDGSRLSILKEEPAVGVSSTGMANSIKGSVLRALGTISTDLVFV